MTNITADEWLAELERIQRESQRDVEGWTSDELCAAWGVSIKTVWLILRDAQVTLKKRPYTPANATRRA